MGTFRDTPTHQGTINEATSLEAWRWHDGMPSGHCCWEGVGPNKIGPSWHIYDQGCWKHPQEKVLSNYDTCSSFLKASWVHFTNRAKGGPTVKWTNHGFEGTCNLPALRSKNWCGKNELFPYSHLNSINWTSKTTPLQFPSATNWTKEQPYYHIKKLKKHLVLFLDHASEDIKSLELNDPDSLDDLDPLALELFFSFVDPLLSCKKWWRVECGLSS